MNYEVVSQTEGLDITNPAAPVKVMQIAIRTKPSGVLLTVDVPLSDYTADNVKRILTERASVVELVHAGE